MRAPNSMSFLSKAYNFLKGKTSRNDETFYTKSPLPSEIYPVLCEPIDCKEMARNSWKGRQALGELSNRPISDREQMKQRARFEGFSPRAVVKNYWSGKEEKKINTELETQQPQNNKVYHQGGEEEDEEGVFSIQVRSYVTFASKPCLIKECGNLGTQFLLGKEALSSHS